MANVNVTYEQMRSAGTRLVGGQQEILEKLTGLQSLIQSLVAEGYVTDRSSKQFETSYTEFNHGVTQTLEGLKGMSDYLNKAAQTFEQADQSLGAGLHG
ncbi:WXG100 family type VII secretion target [Embleya sp. NBC_00896]|uniref:WXG100 family type VII secretion target n=1 Tax=Embleya sp. NBC_00896 TaxID=2975961 RepID=UPI002F91011C|nr:WXG100 family type VII secretion target [Embleya sp. NBC_00896]